MATGKRGQRAALTSAPSSAPAAPAPRPAAPAPVAAVVKAVAPTAPAAAPVVAPTPAPRSSLVSELAAAERAALKRGDHAAHAALSELHVAAGLLQAKAATRARELTGADAELAKKVLALL